ncbi:MAG: glutathione S-transferase [Deltaproteobacteria bacterium]|nr:glutathione S-transferase [Deltaproteobacteria bacterium]
MGSAVVVHHLENSRSHRVLWLLEELGVPYSIELHRRDPKTHRADESLRRIHPLGKAPLVELDGIVLAESAAILEALLDAFDADHRLHPWKDTPEHRRFRYFMHYAEGSLMPPLLVKLLTGLLGGRNIPAIARPITGGVGKVLDKNYTDPEIHRHLTFLEGELSKRPFLCGDEFTAADIQLGFPLEGATVRAGLTRTAYPALSAYIDTLRARDAYRAAEKRGGPLNLRRFSR